MPLALGRSRPILLVGSVIFFVVLIGGSLVWWLIPTPAYKVAVRHWIETYENAASGLDFGVPIRNPDTAKGGMLVAAKYRITDPKGNTTLSLRLFRLDRDNKVLGSITMFGDCFVETLMSGKLPDGMSFPDHE